MVLQPGATSSLDLEKRDRKMAKVIIDMVGLEPEKYRLGYTKVKALSRQRSLSETSYLLPYFRCCFFDVRCRVGNVDAIHCPSFATGPFSLLFSPLIFSVGVFPRRRSWNDGGDSRGENCQDTQLDAGYGQRQDGQGRLQEAPGTKGMYRFIAVRSYVKFSKVGNIG